MLRGWCVEWLTRILLWKILNQNFGRLCEKRAKRHDDSWWSLWTNFGQNHRQTIRLFGMRVLKRKWFSNTEGCDDDIRILCDNDEVYSSEGIHILKICLFIEAWGALTKNQIVILNFSMVLQGNSVMSQLNVVSRGRMVREYEVQIM